MRNKVLLANESAFTRITLKNILTANKYEVIDEVASAWLAIKKYEELQPDVLIADILMPDMKGIDMIKSIVSIDADAKIIVCSAAGWQDYIIDAIKAGVSDYIVKPFGPERILEALDKVLQ